MYQEKKAARRFEQKCGMASSPSVQAATVVGGSVREQFILAARRFFPEGSPYSQLSKAAVHNQTFLEIASYAPLNQPASFLLFGAMNYAQRREQSPLDEVLQFRYTSEHMIKKCIDYCRANRDRLINLVANKLVQTNHPSRGRTGAIILDELLSIEGRSEIKIHLIELGCSAGINLFMDQLFDSFSPKQRTWKIIRRVGIDLNPLSMARNCDRNWLEALIWPWEIDRLNQLRRSYSLAYEEPTIINGNGSTHLEDQLSNCQKDVVLVIFHSYLLHQLAPYERAVLTRVLRLASHRSRIIEIGIEMDSLFDIVYANEWYVGECVTKIRRMI